MNAYFSLFCIFMDIFLQHSHRLAQYEFSYTLPLAVRL